MQWVAHHMAELVQEGTPEPVPAVYHLVRQLYLRCVPACSLMLTALQLLLYRLWCGAAHDCSGKDASAAVGPASHLHLMHCL